MSNAYPWLLTLGTILGLLWLGLAVPARPRKDFKHPSEPRQIQSFDAALAAFAGGLIGARLSYIVLHWGYFSSRPIEAFMLWQGGLTWVGGALGALITLALYAVLSRLAFWPLADRLALPGVLIAMSSWLGCLFDGCAYGRRIEASFWAWNVEDMFASHAHRWPTQAVGVLFSVLTIIFLLWLSERKPDQGILACVGLLLIALSAFALSFTRSDPVLLLAGIRLDSVGSAVIVLMALSGLLLRLRKA